MTDQPILEIKNLHKYFPRNDSLTDRLLQRNQEFIQAVDDVSFALERGDSQGIIGESGCGKTTFLTTIMGLQDITDGDVIFRGTPMSNFDKQDWKDYRSSVSIIFQDPFNSLDPKLTVRESLLEPLKIHGYDNRNERVRDTLEQVHLNPVENFINKTPGQLSGGELQRVSIARALIIEPDIILADEPVSMLDVSTQASILNLLSGIREEFGVAMFYISHDLSTVSYVCEKVHIMYLGRIVETTSTKNLIEDPKHPYTQGLISAIPYPDPHYERERVEVEGSPQEPVDLGEGCRFRDRCPERMDICEKTPLNIQDEEGHNVACHLYYDHKEAEMQEESQDTVSSEEAA